MTRLAMPLLIAAGIECSKVPAPVANATPAAETPNANPTPVAETPIATPPVNLKLTGDASDPAFGGKKLSECREDLRSKSVGKQLTALRVMRLYGPAAAPATPDIFRVPPAECDDAAMFKAIGPGAISFLIAELPSPRNYYRARQALESLAPLPAREVETLIAKLKDPNANVASSAAAALRVAGEPANKAIPELKRMLGEKDPLLHGSAASALAILDPTVVTALPILAKRPRPEFDIYHALILGDLLRFGPAGYEYVSKATQLPDGKWNWRLMSEWRSCPEWVRLAAAPYLADLVKKTPEPETYIPFDWLVRNRVKDPTAAAMSLEYAKNGKGNTRGYATQAAVVCGCPADQIGPVIIANLAGMKSDDDDALNPCFAAQALGTALDVPGNFPA